MRRARAPKAEAIARGSVGATGPGPNPNGAGALGFGSGGSRQMASPEMSQGGRGRVGFILAAVAYGVWLGFLAVLAVMQKVW